MCHEMVNDKPESLDCQKSNDALIHSARYADAAIAPLVHGLGTPKDEDAPLPFKHPRDRLPGEAGHRATSRTV